MCDFNKGVGVIPNIFCLLWPCMAVGEVGVELEMRNRNKTGRIFK